MDSEIIENEEELEDVDDTDAPVTRGGRGVKKKAAKKKKTAGPKVDPAQALAFVRLRIASEKDPLVKAFYERELTTLQAAIRKAEQDRKANMSFPVKDGTAKIGTHVFEIGGAGGLGYRASGKAVLAEYIVTSIFEQKETYGTRITKMANLRRVRGKGDKRVESGGYRSSDIYLNPRAAVDHALKDAARELADAEKDLAQARALHDTLTQIRANAPEKPPAPTPIDKIKTSTAAKAKAKRVARPSGRVAGKPSSDRAGKRWTDDENRILTAKVAEGMTPEQIAADLGRPRDRVVRQMHKLGIKPPATPFHDFRGELHADAGDVDAKSAAAPPSTQLEGQLSILDVDTGDQPARPRRDDHYITQRDVEEEIAQAGV